VPPPLAASAEPVRHEARPGEGGVRVKVFVFWLGGSFGVVACDSMRHNHVHGVFRSHSAALSFVVQSRSHAHCVCIGILLLVRPQPEAKPEPEAQLAVKDEAEETCQSPFLFQVASREPVTAGTPKGQSKNTVYRADAQPSSQSQAPPLSTLGPSSPGWLTRPLLWRRQSPHLHMPTAPAAGHVAATASVAGSSSYSPSHQPLTLPE
jgi:hypothetical protein